MESSRLQPQPLDLSRKTDISNNITQDSEDECINDVISNINNAVEENLNCGDIKIEKFEDEDNEIRSNGMEDQNQDESDKTPTGTSEDRLVCLQEKPEDIVCCPDLSAPDCASPQDMVVEETSSAGTTVQDPPYNSVTPGVPTFNTFPQDEPSDAEQIDEPSNSQEETPTQNSRVRRIFCFYCKKFLGGNFRRHVLRKHRNEEPVVRYVAMFQNDKEGSKAMRLMILNDLRVKGNDYYNERIAKDPAFIKECMRSSAGNVDQDSPMRSDFHMFNSFTQDEMSDLEEQNQAGSSTEEGPQKRRRCGRKNYCLFCRKPLGNFRRHILRKHCDEEPVARYLAMLENDMDGSKEMRKTIMNELRIKGNSIYNETILKDPAMRDGPVSKLLPSRRPAPHRKRSVEDFVTCMFCKGLFVKRSFYKHVPNCTERVKTNEDGSQSVDDIDGGWDSSLPYGKCQYFIKKYGIESFPQLPKVNKKPKDKSLIRTKDIVVKTALKDPLLMSVASNFLGNHFGKKTKYKLSKRMRDGGDLLMNMQRKDSSITEFRDCLSPSKVNIVIETVKEMCKENKTAGNVETVSMPSRLAWVINEAATRVIEDTKSDQLLSNEKKESVKQSIEEFLNIKRRKWKSVTPSCRMKKRSKTSSGDFDRDYIGKQRIFYSDSTPSPSEDDTVNMKSCSEEKNLPTEDFLHLEGSFDNCLPISILPSHTKRRWTEEEKCAVISEFKECIVSGTNPGLKRCGELIERSEMLSGRTSAQINSMIDNINKGKLKLPPQFQYLKT